MTDRTDDTIEPADELEATGAVPEEVQGSEVTTAPPTGDGTAPPTGDTTAPPTGDGTAPPTGDGTATAVPPPSPPSPEPLRRARATTRVVLRAATASLALAVTAGAVLLGEQLPPPAPVAVPAVDVEVPPAATSLVCPGPPRLPTEPEPGGDVSYDPQFDPAPEDSTTTLRAVVVGDGTGAVRRIEGGDVERVRGADATAVTADVEDAGTVLEVRPGGEVTPDVAAAVGTDTGAGDLRGLAAASCTRPGTDLWLVGGSTSLGSSARLVLQNPGRTPATVSLELWGPVGPVELAGSPELLVPPGAERVVLLEGLAAEQRRVVVHATATGGVVAAHLQDSALRGLVPGGADVVVPGAAPAVRQVVTGLDVPATSAEGADTAVLRLLAPQEATTARVALHGPEGEVDLPGTSSVRLDAGSVIDVPLGGLPEGSYTAVVSASRPVVAGGMITRGGTVGRTGDVPDLPLDRAWLPAASAGPGAVALPAGLPGRLSIGVVPGSGPAWVGLDVVDAEGGLVGTVELDVAEGTTRMVDLADLLAQATDAEVPEGDGEPPLPAGVVLRTAHEGVVWAAVLTASREEGDVVAAVTPVPPEQRRPEVSVTVR